MFAPNHVLQTNSGWSGGEPFRADLRYESTLAGMETAKMTFGHDEIGRLGSISWDRAAGSVGTDKPLAEYGWAGGLRRSRTVHFGNTQYPEARSQFSYDRYGRLTQIKDDVYTAASTFTTPSQFDYVYDSASNLTKELYNKVGGKKGDMFAYDGFHRLTQAWMGADQATVNGPVPPISGVWTESLGYGHDAANNRTSSTAAGGTTSYTLQQVLQGPSNRYEQVQAPGAAAVTLEYDDRGNLTYDGKFKYRYDYMNRLQEVWRVLPVGEVPVDGEKYGVVQEGALDDAQAAVKLEVPDLYTRLAHEHTDPIFRARLRATIVGGVLRITPTAQGGGGRPGFLPITGTLELVAVYLYDAFNRRTASIIVDTSVGETQVHTWDGWRQTAQHKVEETSQGSGVWVASPTKQFVWGSRLDELVAYRRKNGANWENYFILHGGQDTAAKLVDSSGNVVEQYECDPYGRVTCYKQVAGVWTAFAASQVGLPFLWKAIRLDAVTGLLQMRNRYYSVDLGRFLTGDPSGVWFDPINYGCQYCYSGDNPLVLGDPLGLQSNLKPGFYGPPSLAELANHPELPDKQDYEKVGEFIGDNRSLPGRNSTKGMAPVPWRSEPPAPTPGSTLFSGAAAVLLGVGPGLGTADTPLWRYCYQCRRCGQKRGDAEGLCQSVDCMIRRAKMAIRDEIRRLDPGVFGRHPLGVGAVTIDIKHTPSSLAPERDVNGKTIMVWTSESYSISVTTAPGVNVASGATVIGGDRFEIRNGHAFPLSK